jgi:hypothetical protein
MGTPIVAASGTAIWGYSAAQQGQPYPNQAAAKDPSIADSVFDESYEPLSTQSVEGSGHRLPTTGISPTQ